MGQAMALPFGIAVGWAAYYVYTEFIQKRPMHQPGHVDEMIEQSIAAVRGESGRREYREAKRRDREEYPLPGYLKSWQEVSKISLAVTGESGTGKSSLINALIGSDMAATGVEETTATPTKPYVLPVRCEHSSEKCAIHLWDLPGQGTLNYPADTYIKDLGLRYYDAVILVLHNRVKEVNVKLVRELEKHDVPLLVVVNKMDDLVESAKQDTLQRDMAETFNHVRTSYAREFNRRASVGIRLFLLSTRVIRQEKASIGAGSNPINRDWEPFQNALVQAVGKARGVTENMTENKVDSRSVGRASTVRSRRGPP